MDKIQTFRPTMEQFQHFDKYIKFIETRGGNLAGIARVSIASNFNGIILEINSFLFFED